MLLHTYTFYILYICEIKVSKSIVLPSDPIIVHGTVSLVATQATFSPYLTLTTITAAFQD